MNPIHRDWKQLVRARIEPLDDEFLAAMFGEGFLRLREFAAGVIRDDASPERLRSMVRRQLPDRPFAGEAIEQRPRPVTPAPPPSDKAGVIRDAIRDTRYAVRLLARAPAFATVAIVTLALGIGANTAIFSVLNAVLLRPLPYADPARLVMIGEIGSNGAGNVGYTTFLDWRDRSHGFEEMALVRSWTATLATNGEPERVAAMRVSANFFRLLGIRPALGRDFRPEEDTPAGWRMIVLSDRLWRRRFGADPNIAGRLVTMNDR